MSAQRYYQTLQGYQEAQLLFAAIRMDLFTPLDEPMDAESFSEIAGCSRRNGELMLMALTSCGHLVKEGPIYHNTEETSRFLSKHSPLYLGDAILFREEMTSLDDLEDQITGEVGTEQPFDFVRLVKASVPEMYSGRAQQFVEFVKGLYTDPDYPLKVLDLGGGSGILDLELMKQYPHGSATVFDRPAVIEAARGLLADRGAERISLIAGDFNKDPIGQGYDLIIASGILYFVDIPMSDFIRKIGSSLNDGGRLIITGQKPETIEGIPNGMLSWLSGFLAGLPLPVTGNDLVGILEGNGFFFESSVETGGFETSSYILGDPGAVSAQDVIDSFIQLTEAIFGSKTNILDFGGGDMVFTRSEIHIIKMVGDNPGTYSAELARQFGVSKPVIHTSIKKLISKGFIRSEIDKTNNKVFKLYLTEKGEEAYMHHAKYHEQYDKGLFDFVSKVPASSMTDIQQFLSHAIDLINNHSGDKNEQ